MAFLEAIFSNPIIAFIILVGVVVFVHELGHYLVGRALGIEVEEFSLGFGPRAIGFRRGNTDYRISWLPLGGYVRFYGSEIGKDIPLEKREKSITTAKLYKRFLVSIAGPGANFVLSFVVMIVLSWVGLPQPASVISVIPGSVAERAGFETGDKIVEVNGEAIRTWGDFNKVVSKSAGVELDVKVERDGGTQSVKVTPAHDQTESAYGETVKVGRIGVTQFMMTPRVVVEKGSAFERAGLQTGDRVKAIGGNEIRYFHEIEKVTRTQNTWPVVIEVERPTTALDAKSITELLKPQFASEPKAVTLTEQPPQTEHLYSTDSTLVAAKPPKRGDKTTAAVEAFRACGLSTGDTIIEFKPFGAIKNPVQLGIALEKAQTAAKGRPHAELAFTVLDLEGNRAERNCVVPMRKGKDALNRDQDYIDFPFQFATRGVPVEPVILKSEGLAAFTDGAKAASEQAATIFVGIKKLVTGNVPLANLGGPIAIARVAGDAAQGGLLVFVLTISWMSINIGMFNLLPLPALDGGTILLQLVEGAYGRPLPTRVQENVQRLGILFILVLILVVFYNDILRLFHS